MDKSWFEKSWLVAECASSDAGFPLPPRQDRALIELVLRIRSVWLSPSNPPAWRDGRYVARPEFRRYVSNQAASLSLRRACPMPTVAMFPLRRSAVLSSMCRNICRNYVSPRPQTRIARPPRVECAVYHHPIVSRSRHPHNSGIAQYYATFVLRPVGEPEQIVTRFGSIGAP